MITKATTLRNLVVVLLAGLLASLAARPGRAQDAAYRAAIESDWASQERRLGRTVQTPEAIRARLAHAQLLLQHLPALSAATDRPSQAARIEQLGKQARELPALDDAARRKLYHAIRWAARELALANLPNGTSPLVFMKRVRFPCQMLHEYLGYFCDYGDVSGGGVYVLDEPGRSFAVRDLLAGRLPRGNYATLALDYDARTIYFAFAQRAPAKPDFFSPERQSFHLFAIAPDGQNLRQLTDGCYDDFDPCPLPDGGLAFLSTRRGGFTRCNNPWEPIAVYTLHRCDAGGRHLRTLSFHETNEWHPSVLHDGRIVYTRWDYVDRSAANHHGLWACNPDGSGAVSLFGNYTYTPNACYQPRAIPGSRRIVFVAGAHHADVGGALVLLDPARTTLDPANGQDRLEALDVLTPEVCFPEAAGWPQSYFHSPWPLSEEQFLVAFSFDRIPGMSSGGRRDTAGLYYFDRFGGLELLYRDPELACMYPIPLAARPRPPVIAAVREESLADEGELLLSDVRRSLRPLPEDRPVRELRIFQVFPKSTPTSNAPRIGHANAESARMLLGTVPVEADGSAHFRVPACKPLYFQAVDDRGRAVQSMRSVVYLQPGERRGCVGCHEPPGTAPAVHLTRAAVREASVIRPGPDGTQPLSYPRLVQPVLDRHCVRCHGGRPGAQQSPPRLTGEPAARFTRSYESLKPYLRWCEWGDGVIATPPGAGGADRSPLVEILSDGNHAAVKLPDEDRRRLYLWLDGNVPFYGTYDAEEQATQRRGEPVRPPSVQ